MPKNAHFPSIIGINEVRKYGRGRFPQLVDILSESYNKSVNHFIVSLNDKKSRGPPVLRPLKKSLKTMQGMWYNEREEA
ncbi:hypothetical protein EV207_11475 [Scopulibacillus darangshiensis]|uniref:Uncharacterized protein n=1 Tax=Scopulibacillus darangshiensis TaxID=442528 RepID=A0A4R2P2N6_9BACL|nr:hypothetical protein EV207_11475 [Scopulibacillus darangshiensis]